MGIYIGQQRLGYLWEKIKAIIPTKISDLSNDAGYTTNTGTITGITMNGTSKGTSGIVNLGTVITEHQDISGKANSVDVYTKLEVDDMIEDVAYLGDAVGNETTANFNAQADTVWNKAQTLGSAQQAQARSNIGAQEALVSGTNIKTINNESILGSGNITISGGGEANVIETVKVNGTALTPDANKAVDVTVPTESTVAGWGFTKNGGTVTSTGGTVAVNNIQVVSALPASPDANTLYLIPE